MLLVVVGINDNICINAPDVGCTPQEHLNIDCHLYQLLPPSVSYSVTLLLVSLCACLGCRTANEVRHAVVLCVALRSSKCTDSGMFSLPSSSGPTFVVNHNSTVI